MESRWRGTAKETTFPISPAMMLAIVLLFLGPPFANLPFVLERNHLASIFLHLVAIGAMVAAPIATTGRD